MGELKLYRGSNIETCNTQKSEVFLLRISSGNVNASVVVTCQYPQIYEKIPQKNFTFCAF